jgi:diguanylate cyclase (GGDEF)-like protein
MDGHAAELRVVDNAELIGLIHAFSAALEGHYDWLWQVQRAVVCRRPGEAPEHECALARWCKDAENRAALQLRCDPSVLMAAHETVHTAAGLLLDRARGGSVPASAYDEFLTARKAFKSAAVALERALWSQTCLLDSLTGVRNRHGMLLELREEQQRARRDRHPCLLAMMDIDHFKHVNDRHGHAAGDMILRDVTRTAARRLRPNDRIYRYGGEEFLICLPQTDVTRGRGIIERLREEIAARPVYVAGNAIVVTVSFGLAEVDTEGAIEESILRADRALYGAKASGRNRVFAAQE